MRKGDGRGEAWGQAVSGRERTKNQDTSPVSECDMAHHRQRCADDADDDSKVGQLGHQPDLVRSGSKVIKQRGQVADSVHELL